MANGCCGQLHHVARVCFLQNGFEETCYEAGFDKPVSNRFENGLGAHMNAPNRFRVAM